jgi:PKD repeat protein
MAEQESPRSGKLSGWIKAILGAIGGICSGVLAMNLTAYLNNAVKPAKPIANFGAVPEGLTVQFQNLSQGGQGWWDFGDGTPLQPVTPDHEFVTHTYPRPGDYTVKLSLHNVVNDESERSVPVHVDDKASPAALPPHIDSLVATPLSPGSYAPATIRLVSKVSHADVCVWDLGTDQPLEVITDSTATADQDRLVTFRKPGNYVIKLAAVNGTRSDEKTETVTIKDPPAGAATFVLNVCGKATHVMIHPRDYIFGQTFPREATGDTYHLDLRSPGRPDHIIADVTIKGPTGSDVASLGQRTALDLDAEQLGLHSVRNLHLEVADDRQSVRLTGDLVRDPAHRDDPCGMVLPVVLREQKRVSMDLKAQEVTAVVALPENGSPSSVMLPFPPLAKTCEKAQRNLTLQLRDGDQVVWQDTQLTKSAIATLQKRRFVVTATKMSDQVRVDMIEAPPAP